MQRIEITNDWGRKVNIGKELYKEHIASYNEKNIKLLHDQINCRMLNASDAEKEEVFFHSIYDYWVYGNSIKEEFYYDFLHKTHEEKLEYLTFRNRFLYYNYLNDQKDKEICCNKWESYKKFKDYYGRDVILLESEKDYDAFLSFVTKHEEFVIKPVDLGMGQGVRKVSAKDKNIRQLFNDIIGEINEVVKEYNWGKSASVIIEEIIPQSSKMAKFHPQSVNSVRVPTLIIDGEPQIYHPWFMTGRSGKFAMGDDLNYKCNIDVETGVVNSMLCGQYGERFEKHPDTGEQVVGFTIPDWDDLKRRCIELAKLIPTVRYVGWDMALTDEYGWVIMEANECGEPLWQLNTGRGYKKELETLIHWKPECDFWWEN